MTCETYFLNYFHLATHMLGTGCQVYEESCGKPTPCQHKCTNNTVCHEDDDDEACRKPNICEQRPQRKLTFLNLIYASSVPSVSCLFFKYRVPNNEKYHFVNHLCVCVPKVDNASITSLI